MSDDFTIFSGTANPGLAEAIARELGEHTGACTVDRFPDGVVSAAPLIAAAMEWSLDWNVRKHEPTIVP